MAAIERVDREGPQRFLEEFAGQLVGSTTRAERPGVMEAVRQIVDSPPASAVKAALGAMATRLDSRPLLPTIKVPTLVVVGEEDALTPPAAAEAMVQAIPGSRLAKIPQAGHLSNLEAPEPFNRAVRDFLLALRA
jgi:pimeloyl-ACP methyl ester carboxylesterase